MRTTNRTMGKSSSVRTINPLSNPKGVVHECELCQKPAFLVCQCGVTCYWYERCTFLHLPWYD